MQPHKKLVSVDFVWLHC